MDLKTSNLAKIESNLDICDYNRSIPASIVHLGMGNFHRAHQAYYLHQLLNKNFETNKEWGLCGVEVRPNPRFKEYFEKQDTMYTLIMRSAQASEDVLIGSIVKYIYAVDNTNLAVEQIAAETTRILSLTVTENGYSQDKRTGKLALNSEVIQEDLLELNKKIPCPKTAVGLMVAGLKIRFERKMKGLTIMCCDNLKKNGEMCEDLVLTLAGEISEHLVAWIKENVTFPNSMVDRITPASDPKNEEYLLEKYGYIDKLPVMGEDFIQWVLEDNFCQGRPEWEKVGVTMTNDVIPYELTKLRILNAGHFTLTYPAALLDYDLVDEVLLKENLVTDFVLRYMDQVGESLPKCEIDVPSYKLRVIERFQNPAISDQVERLLKDGSSKIMEYVAHGIRALIESSKNYSAGALVVAFFVRGNTGISESGKQFNINDDRKTELNELAKSAVESRTCDEFVRIVMGNFFSENQDFMTLVNGYFVQILDKTTRTVLENFLSQK